MPNGAAGPDWCLGEVHIGGDGPARGDQTGPDRTAQRLGSGPLQCAIRLLPVLNWLRDPVSPGWKH